jgi:pimeloyl-ACP methyl ester carboxylesterase
VLIGGSGAEDRDLTGLGHKTFLVLADHLTRKGIAVLRCDDRDFGKPANAMKSSLLRDFVSDVKAELAWVRARPEIDARRVGLLGGSLGGVIGPATAAEDTDVAFVVMLAGLGVPTIDAVAEQRAMIARSEGASSDEIAQIRAIWPGVHRQIREAKDDAAAQSIVKAALARTPKARPPVYPTVDIAAGMMGSAYARDLYWYDPAPVFAKIKVPVLSIIGALDVQVSAAQNNAGLRKLLAKHPDATIIDLPGVNHLFQHAKTGAMSEYALIEESFAPDALELISNWILKRVAHDF